MVGLPEFIYLTLLVLLVLSVTALLQILQTGRFDVVMVASGSKSSDCTGDRRPARVRRWSV